jgi:hypothetical protein
MSNARIEIVGQFRTAVQHLAQYYASEDNQEQGPAWGAFLRESAVRYANDHSLELMRADIEQHLASRDPATSHP